MIPEKFSYFEGGNWEPWPALAGEPPLSFYDKRDPKSVCHIVSDERHIYLWSVHALVTPQGYRWDCINGWTGKL